MLAVMRTLGFALIAVLASSSPALAQEPEPSPEEEARELFGAGSEAFGRGVYGAALEYFERAYAVLPLPELLFNIGVASQRSGRNERALEAFEQYLRDAPGAANRGDVEARIVAVRSVIQDEQGPPPDAPPPPIDDGDAGGPGVVPWIVMGGSAAVLGTGIVLFAMAQGDISAVEDAPDGSSWPDVRDARDRAPTFSALGLVLAGVGAAGVAVGIVLLTSGGTGDGPEVGIGPGGVVARGRF